MPPGAGAAPAKHERQSLSSLPAAAQSVISTALGAAKPAFAARGSAAGDRLAGGGVAADLRADGVAVRAGDVFVSMTVASVGRAGNAQRPTRVRSIGAHANRVSLDRGGLTEWYAAGPLGIEQGFTLSRRPPGADGPVALKLRLDGKARARQDPSGPVFLTSPGRPGIRHGGLFAVDADGRPVRSELRLRDGAILIRVWDKRANYPLVIDPLIQQGGKLTGSGEVGAGAFGSSVALSADGNTAIVGGPNDNGGVGAAWVFTRSGGVWAQQGSKLTGSGVIGGSAQFGASVALSSDGNTALIGGYADDDDIGAAWVFTRAGGIWTQQGSKLPGSGESGAAQFGISVALSADGNTALIGGSADNELAGAAWVFTRSGGVWTQQGAKLTGSGATGPATFGQSVALSADGNTALIGGDGDNDLIGAAWVFTRSAGVWTQQGSKLTGTGEVGTGQFGWSAALSADGNTALVGAIFDNDGMGAAWVFTRSGTTWTQQGSKLAVAGLPDIALIGWSVDLAADGNTALLGGIYDNGGVGAAWLFKRSAGTWAQDGGKLTGAGEIEDGAFGSSVALSSDATTALIGGPDDNGRIGAAWVFIVESSATVPGAPTGVSAVAGNAQATVTFTAPASDGGSPISSYTVTASPGGQTASGAGSPIVVSGLSNGTAYTFTVRATNSVGTGSPSAPSNAVTPSAGGATAPGAPTAVSVSAGDGQVTVSFAPPASNGGAAITSYTVTASPGGQTATRYAGPVLVSGLTNGVSYTFIVTATNSAGTGPPSTASAAVVPTAGQAGARTVPAPPAASPRPTVPDPPATGPRPPAL